MLNRIIENIVIVPFIDCEQPFKIRILQNLK